MQASDNQDQTGAPLRTASKDRPGSSKEEAPAFTTWMPNADTRSGMDAAVEFSYRENMGQQDSAYLGSEDFLSKSFPGEQRDALTDQGDLVDFMADDMANLNVESAGGYQDYAYPRIVEEAARRALFGGRILETAEAPTSGPDTITAADIALIQSVSPATLAAALKAYLSNQPQMPEIAPRQQRVKSASSNSFMDEHMPAGSDHTLYVAHMPSDVTLADMIKVFSSYGRLLGADLLRDGRRIDGKLLRAGFVHFADEESCGAAEVALNRAVMRIDVRDNGTRVITVTKEYQEGLERPLAVRRYTGTKGRTKMPMTVARTSSASEYQSMMGLQPRQPDRRAMSANQLPTVDLPSDYVYASQIGPSQSMRQAAPQQQQGVSQVTRRPWSAGSGAVNHKGYAQAHRQNVFTDEYPPPIGSQTGRTESARAYTSRVTTYAVEPSGQNVHSPSSSDYPYSSSSFNYSAPSGSAQYRWAMEQ